MLDLCGILTKACQIHFRKDLRGEWKVEKGFNMAPLLKGMPRKGCMEAANKCFKWC